MELNKKEFELYAALKMQVFELEKQIEELQPKLMEQIGDTPIDLEGFGTFTRGARKSWTYSQDLEKKKIEVKEQEKVEQQKGIATFVEKPYLMFRQNAN